PAHPFLYFSAIPRPPTSTLFPYTTLFRSSSHHFSRFEEDQREELCGAYSDQSHQERHWHLRHSHQPRQRAARSERKNGRCARTRSEEHTSELQSRENLVCRLLLEKKKGTI